MRPQRASRRLQSTTDIIDTTQTPATLEATPALMVSENESMLESSALLTQQRRRHLPLGPAGLINSSRLVDPWTDDSCRDFLVSQTIIHLFYYHAYATLAATKASWEAVEGEGEGEGKADCTQNDTTLAMGTKVNITFPSFHHNQSNGDCDHAAEDSSWCSPRSAADPYQRALAAVLDLRGLLARVRHLPSMRLTYAPTLKAEARARAANHHATALTNHHHKDGGRFCCGCQNGYAAAPFPPPPQGAKGEALSSPQPLPLLTPCTLVNFFTAIVGQFPAPASVGGPMSSSSSSIDASMLLHPSSPIHPNLGCPRHNPQLKSQIPPLPTAASLARKSATPTANNAANQSVNNNANGPSTPVGAATPLALGRPPVTAAAGIGGGSSSKAVGAAPNASSSPLLEYGGGGGLGVNLNTGERNAQRHQTTSFASSEAGGGGGGFVPRTLRFADDEDDATAAPSSAKPTSPSSSFPSSAVIAGGAEADNLTQPARKKKEEEGHETNQNVNSNVKLEGDEGEHNDATNATTADDEEAPHPTAFSFCCPGCVADIAAHFQSLLVRNIVMDKWSIRDLQFICWLLGRGAALTPAVAVSGGGGGAAPFSSSPTASSSVVAHTPSQRSVTMANNHHTNLSLAAAAVAATATPLKQEVAVGSSSGAAVGDVAAGEGGETPKHQQRPSNLAIDGVSSSSTAQNDADESARMQPPHTPTLLPQTPAPAKPAAAGATAIGSSGGGAAPPSSSSLLSSAIKASPIGRDSTTHPPAPSSSLVFFPFAVPSSRREALTNILKSLYYDTLKNKTPSSGEWDGEEEGTKKTRIALSRFLALNDFSSTSASSPSAASSITLASSLLDTLESSPLELLGALLDEPVVEEEESNAQHEGEKGGGKEIEAKAEKDRKGKTLAGGAAKRTRSSTADDDDADAEEKGAVEPTAEKEDTKESGSGGMVGGEKVPSATGEKIDRRRKASRAENVASASDMLPPDPPTQTSTSATAVTAAETSNDRRSRASRRAGVLESIVGTSSIVDGITSDTMLAAALGSGAKVPSASASGTRRGLGGNGENEKKKKAGDSEAGRRSSTADSTSKTKRTGDVTPSAPATHTPTPAAAAMASSSLAYTKVPALDLDLVWMYDARDLPEKREVWKRVQREACGQLMERIDGNSKERRKSERKSHCQHHQTAKDEGEDEADENVIPSSSNTLIPFAQHDSHKALDSLPSPSPPTAGVAATAEEDEEEARRRRKLLVAASAVGPTDIDTFARLTLAAFREVVQVCSSDSSDDDDDDDDSSDDSSSEDGNNSRARKADGASAPPPSAASRTNNNNTFYLNNPRAPRIGFLRFDPFLPRSSSFMSSASEGGGKRGGREDVGVKRPREE